MTTINTERGPTRPRHTVRVERYYRTLYNVTGGQCTAELARHHGASFHKEARKLKEKAKAGSKRHHEWRRDYLEAARAWYAVARQLPT